MTARRRYHPVQIILHWLIVVLLVPQYATSGVIVRTHEAIAAGGKPSASDLLLHVVHNRGGLIITALMLVRFAMSLWFATWRHPENAKRPSKLATGGHALLYVLIIAQGFTGFVASYFWWPIHIVHVVLFKVILVVVSGHVAMALWHQFSERDGTMLLMLPNFVRRKRGPSAKLTSDWPPIRFDHNGDGCI